MSVVITLRCDDLDGECAGDALESSTERLEDSPLHVHAQWLRESAADPDLDGGGWLRVPIPVTGSLMTITRTSGDDAPVLEAVDYWPAPGGAEWADVCPSCAERFGVGA